MRKGLVGGCIVAALVFGAGNAAAAIRVTTTKDETIAGDGTCSLREAVQTASGLPSPDCPGAAASGVTTIALPAGHYRLSLGSELDLDGDIAIVGGKGDPSQTVIDAALHSRALLTEGTASLSRLTVTGGRAAQRGPTGAPGGGIDNVGTLALSNVVVTDNASGDVTDAGGNLSFPDTSCPAEVTSDPQLGPLQDNGGPTPTMSLAPSSPAINQIPASGAGCPSTDQRNVVRPQPRHGDCDIGAYEFARPVCRPLADATAMGRALRVSLDCGDPSGLALKYRIGRRPTHGSLGTLDAAAGKVTYTPRPGFVGKDSFTYRAANANGTATAQTVTITVLRVPPVLSAARLARTSFRAASGTQLHFTLSATAALTITITHKNGKPAGAVTFAHEPPGQDTVPLRGEVGEHLLAPGAYRAKLVASNAGGHSGVTVLPFTIAPASDSRSGR